MPGALDILRAFVAGRERIWFSPHCLRPQESLFAGLLDHPENDAPRKSDAWMAALGARDAIAEEAMEERHG